MTAIKKTKSKSTASPAPATKPATPPAKIKVAASPATTRASSPPAKVVAPAAPVVSPKPVTQAVAKKPVVTTIIANIDVGFGNALYVRGEGPGLSWNQGLLMTCMADDQWRITLSSPSRPVTFKFLINDIMWSLDADYVVGIGETVTLTPQF